MFIHLYKRYKVYALCYVSKDKFTNRGLFLIAISVMFRRFL